MRHRFHVIGLPHTVTCREYNACAYSQKIRNFCRMMVSRGHSVVHYGVEGAEVPCEIVDIQSEEWRCKFFGPHRPHQMYPIDWDNSLDYWKEFQAAAVAAIRPRVESEADILAVIAGGNHQPICVEFPQLKAVEYGIGYYGVFSKYRCYESNAHRAWCQGASGSTVGDFYHVVIPNYFDTKDFHLAEKKDYILYLGRLIRNKGWHIAYEIHQQTGIPMYVAGQGGEIKGGILHIEGMAVPDVTFFGCVNIPTRAKLMAEARAVFVPTVYIEPFGGVAVESQLSGTPAITSDYGAFTDTVLPEWRCRNYQDFLNATHRAMDLPKEYGTFLRARASSKYSLEAVALEYERYFNMITHPDGWYAGRVGGATTHPDQVVSGPLVSA